MIVLPAWAYLYTKRQYPARGILAWAVLDENIVSRKEAVGGLARLFDISLTNARVLLRKGDGVFWRLSRHNVRRYSSHRLWLAIAAQSNVPEDEYVSVPEDAILSISIMRAFLAQPALTRGPDKPVSVAMSAQLLGCSKRAVTTYRQRLVCAGRVEIVPQFIRLREQKLSMHAPPLTEGEFVKKGWIYRRTSDVILVKNSLGDILTWPVHKVTARSIRPRRYFTETRNLERWVAKGKAIAKDAVLRVFQEWIPVTNVLSVVRGQVLLSILDSHHAGNVRSEPGLVEFGERVYSNG